MIKTKEKLNKDGVCANISRDIYYEADHRLNPYSVIVFAGKHVYSTLLAENQSQNLMGGTIEFRRAEFLPDNDALVLETENFNAVLLEGYDL